MTACEETLPYDQQRGIQHSRLIKIREPRAHHVVEIGDKLAMVLELVLEHLRLQLPDVNHARDIGGGDGLLVG